jgi:hypothetical protein
VPVTIGSVVGELTGEDSLVIITTVIDGSAEKANVPG